MTRMWPISRRNSTVLPDDLFRFDETTPQGAWVHTMSWKASRQTLIYWGCQFVLCMDEESHVCGRCMGQPAFYGSDPFDSDVYEDTAPVWLCDPCYLNGADDI